MDESKNTNSTKVAESDVVVEHIFDAPRERVWQAWTDPEQVKRWWGPQYFTSPDARIDLRVGGSYLFCMRSPDGQDYWSTGVYRDIQAPERLVYTDSFADEHGNVIPASQYGLSGDFPDALLVTVTFEELDGGKTKLTVRTTGMPEGEIRAMAASGMSTSLDKLAESLKR